MVGPGHLQLVEEDLRELLVIVLTRVNEDLVRRGSQPVRDRGRLHELRAVAYDGEYPHGQATRSR